MMGNIDNDSNSLFNSKLNEDEEFSFPEDIAISMGLEDKPFGILWSIDEMCEFLEKRGYKIAVFSQGDKEDIKVAVKPGEKIPDPDPFNIKDTFDSEVRKIILKWLLKIGK